MARDIHDHYFHKAKAEGYRSRAAYKLIEIDERKKILHAGDFVLDAGAAPGSWLQVAARRVVSRKKRGLVIGIDKQPIDPNFREDNIITLQGDFTTMTPDELLAPLRAEKKVPDTFFRGDPLFFDVLLSDMAPFTTGDRTIDHHKSIRLCHALLDRCVELLAIEGHLVMKVFEGEAYADLMARTRSAFSKVKGFRPKACRGESTEIYIIAQQFKGRTTDPVASSDEADDDPRNTLPKRKPSRGWGADETDSTPT